MKYRLLILGLIFVFCSKYSDVLAQSNADAEPAYVTVTTLYGVSDFDAAAWQEVEEEYFNKVTSKIDLIKSHEVLVNYFSPQYREIKVINVISDWKDIEQINQMRSALIEEAWPNEEERDEFFERQNGFYRSKHSDEIYLTSEFTKKLIREEGQNMPFIFMVKTNILADSEDENSYENYRRYVEGVLYPNKKILAYHPYKHFWGADSREFVETYVFDSFADVELSKYEGNALMSEMMPDEEERNEFLHSIFSAIESQETSFFMNVPSLSK